MKKFKIKTGDNVRVITGDHKGSEGKVQRIIKSDEKAIVEGVNMVSKHQKPSASNPQGGIAKMEAPIHLSNLSLIDAKSGTTSRVGYRTENGKKVRFSKKSNEII